MSGEKIEKTKNLMEELGVKGEIVHHPDTDGSRSEVVAEALGVPLESIIKCLILKSKGGGLVAAIIPGDQRVDTKKLEALTRMKKFSFASAGDVLESTGFEIGGVPPLVVIQLMSTFADDSILKREFIIGSAGTKHHGLKINPHELKKLKQINFESIVQL